MITMEKTSNEATVTLTVTIPNDDDDDVVYSSTATVEEIN